MDIKSFSVDFTVKDNAEFIKNSYRWIKIVEEMMRDEGYVPFIDIPTQFNTTMTEGGFNIEITAFGAFVGENSWEQSYADAGMATRNTTLPLITLNSKQKQFSKQ